MFPLWICWMGWSSCNDDQTKSNFPWIHCSRIGRKRFLKERVWGSRWRKRIQFQIELSITEFTVGHLNSTKCAESLTFSGPWKCPRCGKQPTDGTILETPLKAMDEAHVHERSPRSSNPYEELQSLRCLEKFFGRGVLMLYRTMDCNTTGGLDEGWTRYWSDGAQYELKATSPFKGDYKFGKAVLWNMSYKWGVRSWWIMWSHRFRCFVWRTNEI